MVEKSIAQKQEEFTAKKTYHRPELTGLGPISKITQGQGINHCNDGGQHCDTKTSDYPS